MEEDEQKHDHREAGEWCLQPPDDGGVVAAGVGDDRAQEPQRQRHKGDGGNALRPPVFSADLGRSEPLSPRQGRTHVAAVHGSISPRAS